MNKKITIKEIKNVLSIGESTVLECELINKSQNEYLLYQSNNNDVLTISENGVVKAINVGTAEVQVSINKENESAIRIKYTVYDKSKTNEVMLKLIESHNSKILIQDVTCTGYQFVYDTCVLGSVNKYSFEPLKIDDSIKPSINDVNRPGIKKESTQFIVVHDTASAAESANALAHAKYVQNGGGGTSWNYSVGSDGVYHQIPNDEVCYHAGDGSRTFQLEDTLVKANPNDEVIITLDEKGYYKINNKATKLRPYKWNNETKTDELDYTVYKTEDINDYGLLCIVGDNGNYFLDKTYFNQTYKYLVNYGGNRNSIGMETMINKGSNLAYTWHRAAKLCAKLCIENNLPISRVKAHHFFSGKNCPQTLRENNLYQRFLECCEVEYSINKSEDEIYINIKENSLVDKYGFLKEIPDYTTSIDYEIEVKNGNKISKIELSSVIEGKK